MNGHCGLPIVFGSNRLIIQLQNLHAKLKHSFSLLFFPLIFPWIFESFWTSSQKNIEKMAGYFLHKNGG